MELVILLQIRTESQTACLTMTICKKKTNKYFQFHFQFTILKSNVKTKWKLEPLLFADGLAYVQSESAFFSVHRVRGVNPTVYKFKIPHLGSWRGKFRKRSTRRALISEYTLSLTQQSTVHMIARSYVRLDDNHYNYNIAFCNNSSGTAYMDQQLLLPWDVSYNCKKLSQF